MTFSEADLQNETMNIFELITFLRDFKVIPKLLTKKDIDDIWFVMSKEWIQSGKGTLHHLDFESFKDMIVRIAVYSYSKPGLKKMTIKLNGHPLLNTEMVVTFCKFLNLDDERMLKRYLEEVGRKTQGDLNYRSSTEDDLKRRGDYRQDRRLEQMQRRAILAAKKRGELVEMPSIEDLSPLPAEPELMPETLEASLLPLHMQVKLYPEYRSVMPELFSQFKHSKSTSSFDLSKQYSEKSFGGDTAESPHMSGNGGDGVDGGPSMEMSGIISAVTIADLGNTQKLLKDYDKTLVRYLSNYIQSTPETSTLRCINSEGCFLDLGTIPTGTQCDIKLHVLNKTTEELYIDVTTRNFESEDVKVTTFPKIMVAGLARYAGVTFTAGALNSGVIGIIDIYTCSNRTKTPFRVEVPVFFRVAPFAVNEKPVSVCTVRTLPALLSKHLALGHTQVVNFQKQQVGGQWIKSATNALVSQLLTRGSERGLGAEGEWGPRQEESTASAFTLTNGPKGSYSRSTRRVGDGDGDRDRSTKDTHTHSESQSQPRPTSMKGPESGANAVPNSKIDRSGGIGDAAAADLPRSGEQRREHFPRVGTPTPFLRAQTWAASASPLARKEGLNRSAGGDGGSSDAKPKTQLPSPRGVRRSERVVAI